MSEYRIEYNVDGTTKKKITIIDATPKVMLGEGGIQTITFLLGFFAGIMVPIILLFAASKPGVEILEVKSPICVDIAHYNPVVVLLLFATTVLGVVLLSWILYRYRSVCLKTKYAHEKTLIDSRVGLAHKALDVAMQGNSQNAKAETMDITLRIGSVDGDKKGNDDDGGDPDGVEPPTNGNVPPPLNTNPDNSAFSFGTLNTSSYARQ